ncbi:hypothetical protein NL676_028618 [Syzygium grande]|nr:hypothetical protein NL676_028618 [Syzygium grande]
MGDNEEVGVCCPEDKGSGLFPDLANLSKGERIIPSDRVTLHMTLCARIGLAWDVVVACRVRWSSEIIVCIGVVLNFPATIPSWVVTGLGDHLRHHDGH